MTTAPIRPSVETGWNWLPQPEAQKLVDELLAEFFSRCPKAVELAELMRDNTGTRFKDWVDSIWIPDADEDTIARLDLVGYEIDHDADRSPHTIRVYRNHLGLFPAICTINEDSLNVAIKVERVADFMTAMHVATDNVSVGGKPSSRCRFAIAAEGDKAQLWAIERHGYTGFNDTGDSDEQIVASMLHLERFRSRPRDFGIGKAADQRAFAEIHECIDAAIADLGGGTAGRDWACDLFFQAERDFWMSRNRAARVQYQRQQALGLGFANHDHHTYRVGRESYEKSIEVFEKLGFFCREKFFAGAEAGWGAQVLEHPCGFVIFADVDMSADEITGDFPHKGFVAAEGFHDKSDVHTIGLWVSLHGESILQAGMHHLECQFDWHALKEQLQRDANIAMMDPFTTFPFLRQAFTEGEQWKVDPARVEVLRAAGKITPEQAERFLNHGARGSHMENLERNDGYKGFNQQGVSDIIARTDARNT